MAPSPSTASGSTGVTAEPRLGLTRHRTDPRGPDSTCLVNIRLRTCHTRSTGRGRRKRRPRKASSQRMTSSNGSSPRVPMSLMRRWGSVQVSVARIGGWPRKLAKRATTGALRASISESPERCSDHVSIYVRRSFSRRSRRMASKLAAVRCLPLNGKIAMFAPRRSSSSHASLRTSSPALRRRRAPCGCAARRPRGVKHPSPGSAWQVGQRRCRQPRAKCSSVAGRVLRSARGSRQRAPGDAWPVGQVSSSHRSRSATRPTQRPRRGGPGDMAVFYCAARSTERRAGSG